MKISRTLILTLIATSLFYSLKVEAKPLKVMAFNTMADIYGDRKKHGKFRDRLKGIADTINRHDPDLISLQEVRTENQLRRIQKMLKVHYSKVYVNGPPFANYTDSTLFIRHSRFKVVREGGFWLGPNPSLPLGWKLSFPRRLSWADVEDRETGEKIKFVGSHFDNAMKNKEPTAKLVAARFKDSSLPVIFAGDTNLWPELDGYKTLTDTFRDTFAEVTEHVYYANSPTQNSDGCNIKKKPTFPECRVDHILLGYNAPWKTKSWGVDTFKYYGRTGFVSDHRAVIVELE